MKESSRLVSGEDAGSTARHRRSTLTARRRAPTDAELRSRPTSGPAFLLDVQGDLVVYATGGAVHLLRLSSGRDVALRLPGAARRWTLTVEPAGLFVSWNTMYNRRLGRLGPVPPASSTRGS